MLQNEFLIGKTGVDTAADGPPKVCHKSVFCNKYNAWIPHLPLRFTLEEFAAAAKLRAPPRGARGAAPGAPGGGREGGAGAAEHAPTDAFVRFAMGYR